MSNSGMSFGTALSNLLSSIMFKKAEVKVEVEAMSCVFSFFPKPVLMLSLNLSLGLLLLHAIAKK